jgi:hypothetical protein
VFKLILKGGFMKKITTLFIAAFVALGIGVVTMSAPAYAAVDCNALGPDATSKDVVACSACQAEGGAEWDQSSHTCTRPGGQGDLNTIIRTIINVMLFIIGILCVIMIIFGGIRYATSTGDKGRVDNAKNTILYAVVGLVVAILAFAIVNWVIGALGTP